MHYGHLNASTIVGVTSAITTRLAEERRYLHVRLPRVVKPLPGYPSLFYIRGLRGETRESSLIIFGRPTSKPSLQLIIPEATSLACIDVDQVAISITSSLFLDPGRVDIGFNIKFSKYSLQVPDYVRRVNAWSGGGATGGDQWEYIQS